MKDWFERGQEKLLAEAAEVTGLASTDVQNVYSFLAEIGLIDYDVEKDVIFERYEDSE